MLKSTRIIIAVCALLSNTVCANSPLNQCRLWDPGITLSLGPTWSNPGETQTIYFLPTLPQTYVAKTTTVTLQSGEVFLNLQKTLTSALRMQIGVAFAASAAVPLKGVIWQDNDPDFNNFNYSYKIKHTHVALRAKLLKDIHTWFEPYLSASVGLGFNRAYDFSDTPTIPEVVTEPPFAANTNTAFTYTLDVGLHKSLDEHWSVEMGYEFADWGKTNLGAASGQTSSTGLSLNHVYTNELQFSLNFSA